MFEEESKGQSNRELHADFLSLFESAPMLTLGEEIGVLSNVGTPPTTM
jgi:hypothetical protein